MNISIHPESQTLTITFVSRRADGAASTEFAEPAIKEKLPKSTFGGSKSVSFVDVDTWQKKNASSQLISTHINFMHNSTKMILKIFFRSLRILYSNFTRSDRLRFAFSDGCTLM